VTNWKQIETDAPEFADRVRQRFESGKHKTLATLRRDGSPRISGTEVEFADGEVTLGMMGGSRKLDDVRRDPRVAIHSPTVDPPEGGEGWPGEAKLAGTLVAVPQPDDDPQEGAGYFRLDITEVALTYLGGEPVDLLVESWHPGGGHRLHPRG
jgi:hypothetical protein